MTSGIGQPVSDLAAFPLGVHQASGPQDRQVLGDVGLAGADLLRQATDLDRAGRQRMQDLEPAWIGERLQDVGLQDRDLIHAPTIAICAVLMSAAGPDQEGHWSSADVRRVPMLRESGSGGRIRTYDQAVNSRPLYH